MSVFLKYRIKVVLILMLGFFQINTALAQNDTLVQQKIKTLIAESTELQGTQIEVHVKQRLVILSGEVRLYEQKLISERLAWTTPDVFEVDNEIKVVPKFALTDAAIERKILEMVKADEYFRNASVVVRVNSGEVSLKGSFIRIHDPSRLKHKVAEIEGVIDIRISTTFLAQSKRNSVTQG